MTSIELDDLKGAHWNALGPRWAHLLTGPKGGPMELGGVAPKFAALLAKEVRWLVGPTLDNIPVHFDITTRQKLVQQNSIPIELNIASGD